MITTIRPHVEPYTIAFTEHGTRHWVHSRSYELDPRFYDYLAHHVKTVCGIDRERHGGQQWYLYDWEQGWDPTCQDCIDADPVVTRQQPIDYRLEAAYNAFKDSDDRGLSWKHSVRAAVFAAGRHRRQPC